MIIRSAAPGDARALLSIYAPYVTDTAVSFEYDVPTEAEFAERIARTLLKYPYLVLEEAGEIQGYAYAGPFKGRAAYDWSAEVTVYVRWGAHGRGYGRKLYEALERALRDMGIRNLYACIAYTEAEDPFLTQDSPRFHEKMGYRLCGTFRQCAGKFGRWYDMIWMEKIIGAPRESPAAIRWRQDTI